MNYTIRQVTPDDLPFMWDMLWEADAVNPWVRSIGKEQALQLPDTRRYLDGWGRAGDGGVIAVQDDGTPLGATWYRLFPADYPAYGFVAADVPELTISAAEQARGQGVGGTLLDALKELARQQGFRRLSLSVDRQNPAWHLYERKGFHDAGVSTPEDSSITLVAEL